MNMESQYPFRYLTGFRLRVFRAAADRIVPPAEGAPGGGSLSTAAMVDWSLDKMDAKLRSKFLLLLGVLQGLGILFGGKFFTANSPAAQDRQLRWMENNRLRLMRLGFFGLSTFVKMGYYTREENFPNFRYPGPLFPQTPYPDPTVRRISQGAIRLEP